MSRPSSGTVSTSTSSTSAPSSRPGSGTSSRGGGPEKSSSTSSSNASLATTGTGSAPTLDGPELSLGGAVAYSPLAINHNHHLVEYCRTSMAALAGCTAGIIGLTSLQGFAFFLLMVLALWVMILAKAGSNWRRFFTSKWAILTNGFLGALTTYVLFWTFLYGMVHVY